MTWAKTSPASSPRNGAIAAPETAAAIDITAAL